jgi:hypothetical protein
LNDLRVSLGSGLVAILYANSSEWYLTLPLRDSLLGYQMITILIAVGAPPLTFVHHEEATLQVVIAPHVLTEGNTALDPFRRSKGLLESTIQLLLPLLFGIVEERQLKILLPEDKVVIGELDLGDRLGFLNQDSKLLIGNELEVLYIV